ncbi:hypothetical protein PENANT_c001G03448 [Penicillium antarcticum]|uniref:Uncharacterized protein n=1 Tax=Penicillium antarcticum TaxID=416450 RepID=A0A1V6QNA9_9EURO|nr:hypothetical protein PENANT_c001G03448 [Penicillium antarcticum]
MTWFYCYSLISSFLFSQCLALHTTTAGSTNISAQRLANKLAVVTGASSGVGRAIALLYALHGAKLICADLRSDIDTERSGQPPETPTHALINERGGQAVFLRCNVTKAAEVEALANEAVQAIRATRHVSGGDYFQLTKVANSLKSMVNNAGVNVEAIQPVTIYESSEELFDQTFAINTKGVFLGMKYATAQMMKDSPHPSGDLG